MLQIVDGNSPSQHLLGKNCRLVTDEPVEFEKLDEVQDFRRIADHF